MDKPKVAFYWCASCGGCEEAVVDLAEEILELVAAVDIVFWPVALDFKKADLSGHPDRSIAVSFINGAVRTSEQCEMARLLRQKSALVVAFGACSQMGGIPGLGALYSRDALLAAAYRESPSVVNPEGVLPAEHHSERGHDLELPSFYETVHALDAIIDVDYYIPGCAPPPKLLLDGIGAILGGNLPAKGSVLAPDHALCQDCLLADSKPEKLLVAEFKRPDRNQADSQTCLLAQGFLCLGPATRAGCGAACVAAAMPCTGCFGPTSTVQDFGAKALSSIASVVDSTDEEEIERIMQSIPDPAGTFYRYGVPYSLLRRAR